MAQPRRRQGAADRGRPMRLRFPCGHVELQDRVGARTRRREGATWVACARCNVVALVVLGPPAR